MLFHLIRGKLFITKCYLTIEQHFNTPGVPTPSGHLQSLASDASSGTFRVYRSFSELVPVSPCQREKDDLCFWTNPSSPLWLPLVVANIFDIPPTSYPSLWLYRTSFWEVSPYVRFPGILRQRSLARVSAALGEFRSRTCLAVVFEVTGIWVKNGHQKLGEKLMAKSSHMPRVHNIKRSKEYWIWMCTIWINGKTLNINEYHVVLTNSRMQRIQISYIRMVEMNIWHAKLDPNFVISGFCAYIVFTILLTLWVE